MNHLHARSELSAFLDGELGERESEELSRHLRSCLRCRQEAEELRLLRGTLASLPRWRLSEEGHRRLMNELAGRAQEREAAERRRRAAVIPQVATAAAVLLALLVVTVALMTTPASRNSATLKSEGEGEAISTGPATGEEEAGPETSGKGAQPSGETVTAGAADQASKGGLLAAIPLPQLEYAGREYNADQVSEYSADLGARLDFYSRVWHPATPGKELVAAARRSCRDSLEEQARNLGRDAAELMRALDAAEASMGVRAAEALPCFVEEAGYGGRRVYIISYSRPDDSMLFTDRDLVLLVNLIRQSSPDELMRGIEAQRELAASLTPPPRFEAALSAREGEQYGTDLAATSLGDFQAVLRVLASENNLVSYLRELSRLDSGHLLSAVFQELGSPLQISSRLLELLTMRVWVVEAASGEVLLRPYR